MGQSFPGEVHVEVSESKITELFIFMYAWDDSAMVLTGDFVAWFVFLGNCEFERNPLKIWKTMRDEEPTTVRPEKGSETV